MQDINNKIHNSSSDIVKNLIQKLLNATSKKTLNLINIYFFMKIFIEKKYIIYC